MLPTLQTLRDGNVHTVDHIYVSVARELDLDEADLSEPLPSGSQTRFENRVTWAIFHMTQASLLKRVRRGAYQLSPVGRQVLENPPQRIDQKFLRQFPPYRDWESGFSQDPGGTTGVPSGFNKGGPIPGSRRIVIGISGASGAVYGVRLIERLSGRDDIETHLVVTRPGEKTLHQETGRSISDLRGLVNELHPVERIGATIASGSFLFDAMAVVPCSIHTMSAIASGLASNLLTRTADVALKERRRLILAVRETPLHLGHLRNLTALAEMGAIIAPPMPAFYTLPETLDDIVDQQVGRLLDLLGCGDGQVERWSGI